MTRENGSPANQTVVPTTVALYARYSSDNQRDASVEDQLRLCRIYAERQGWRIVDSYADRAISGASLLRPGIQKLMIDAGQGRFEIILAESLDRISRDQEDVAGVFKRAAFAGVKIVTLSEGEIGYLHVGLKGTMNALYLKDLAEKTRRGLRGRVEAGKAGGGLCYGYDVVKKVDAMGNPIRGDRAIDEAEAQFVRRIFREFVAGKSPRAIAGVLNGEKVPGPEGRAWIDTTIRGHVSRGTGILNNELYVGRIVWNRLRYIKDPDTGKRVSRINPKSEWVVQEVPDLRIIDNGTWEAAKQRQAELTEQYENAITSLRKAATNRLNAPRRAPALLSGLLICGVCGGTYGSLTKDRYGCINHYRRGGCSNGNSIRKAIIEVRVLAGLKEKLLAPEKVADAVRAFHEERNRLNREHRAQYESDRQALLKIERQVKQIITTIEEGGYQRYMTDRLNDLERQQNEIEARLAVSPPETPDVHPNVADLYAAKVARLVEALNDPASSTEAAEVIRTLIGKVVLMPGHERGEVEAMLYGELAAILLLAQARDSKKPASPPASEFLEGSQVWGSVVAGAGFEPATFRL